MMLKTIVINIACFVIGVGGGMLLSRKYYNNLVEEELVSIREAFRPKDVIEKIQTVEEVVEPINDVPVINIQSFRSRSSIITNPYEQVKRNYNLQRATPEEEEAASDEEENEEDNNDFDDDSGSTFDITKVDRTAPYVIDEGEFSTEFDHHDKSSLIFYRLDGLLVDEDKTIIDNAEEIIGDDALVELEQQSTVLVRNEPLCIDYEIMVITNSTFDQAMLGINARTNMSPRELHIARQKRKDSNGK